MFARVVSAICRTRLTDTTSGFRAGNRRAISLFAAAYPHDYPEVEAVIIAHRAGLRIVEVPVQMRERQGGRSSITPLRSAYYMLKVLMAVAHAAVAASGQAAGGALTRLTFVSLVVATALLLLVLELVRRRRLQERYSVLWLATGLTLFVLAAWPSLLARIAHALGIAYAPQRPVRRRARLLLGCPAALLARALQAQRAHQPARSAPRHAGGACRAPRA